MSLLDKISKFFRIKREPPLTQPEDHLFMQLKSNRETALKLIPDDMKEEFLSSVYSDRGLRQDVREVYHNYVVSNTDRGEFLKLMISGCLGIKGFGSRLLAYHRIDPKEVAQIMLRGINL